MPPVCLLVAETHICRSGAHGEAECIGSRGDKGAVGGGESRGFHAGREGLVDWCLSCGINWGDLLVGINPHVLPAGGDAVPGGEGDAAGGGGALGNYSRGIVSMC